MLLFILFFLLGDCLLQGCSFLPPLSLLIPLVIFSFVLSFYFYKRNALALIPFSILAGFTFSDWYAQSIIMQRLPKELEGIKLNVTGHIASLPSQETKQQRFLFSVDTINEKKNKKFIYLSWQGAPHSLRVGDKWALVVRLKRIHGRQNFNTFDYERWALLSGINASGYVMTNEKNTYLQHDWNHHLINQLRQLLQVKLQDQLPNSSTSPWLLALMIGERQGIPAAHWQILRKTGTNHLMAVAGLHIGMIAWLAFMMVNWCWRQSAYLMLIFPAQHVAACASLVIAALYSLCSGFSLPTKRALIMLVCHLISLLLRREVKAWYPWSLALFFVLFLNPMSTLSESFWLSFGTIALIIYGMSGRLAPKGNWWRWGRVQWVIGVGLIPLSIAMFHECSLISFIANSIAIPWLSFLVLPFCFLALSLVLVFPSASHLFLVVGDKSLSALWSMLSWFSALPFSVWTISVPHEGFLISSFISVLMLLLPAGFPGKWMSLIWIVPLIFFKTPKPQPGDIWLSILDVGQGLSVVIQTRSHTLVYDTGAKFLSSDMGEEVVIPFLNYIKAKKIDMLVISHGDNDHMGGAEAIINHFKIKSIRSSLSEKKSFANAKPCYSGLSWQWDTVNFHFFESNELKSKNNRSCVLRIDNGKYSVLLPGDIEQLAEESLLKQYSPQFSSTILLAPHHGSQTSSSEHFLKAVNPQYVIYATGYRNRYHFPHAEVKRRYERNHTIQLNTVQTGSIHFNISSHSLAYPLLYREKYKRYWMDA